MLWNLHYTDVIAKASHFIALGDTKLMIEADGAPWEKAVEVEAGGGYRLNGPSGVRFTAYEAGLTLSWSLDFEPPNANGRGVSLFDRDVMRDAAMRLTPETRQKFANFLRGKVLPEVAKRTKEIRDTLRSQSDSEDCLRGIIAQAEAETVSP